MCPFPPSPVNGIPQKVSIDLSVLILCGVQIKRERNSGDCTTVATQPRQLHYSNNFLETKRKRVERTSDVCTFRSTKSFCRH